MYLFDRNIKPFHFELLFKANAEYIASTKFSLILNYLLVILEGYAKVFALTFYFIPFLILWLFFYLFVYSKYTLWQFQNGKVGLYWSKIDQDTRNLVKIQKLKNNSFCSKLCFLNKNCNFSTFEFLHYPLYLGHFWPI